jgi:hypothetical protein
MPVAVYGSRCTDRFGVIAAIFSSYIKAARSNSLSPSSYGKLDAPASPTATTQQGSAG